NKRFMVSSLFLLRAVASQLRRSLPQILFVNCVVEVPDHHLIPGLISPMDGDSRIRVEFILGRIIVMRDHFQSAALGRGDRLFEKMSPTLVRSLPGSPLVV